MTLKEEILEFSLNNKKITTKDIVLRHKISRQFVNKIFRKLIEEGKLIKVGSTRSAFYISPKYAKDYGNKIKKRLKNESLEEHEVLIDMEDQLSLVSELDENIRSIFGYAFSEMLNNAIEHSKSKFIEIEVFQENKQLVFIVNDFGIGAFKNVMKKHKLKSELEAIQDILKGKTTTQPKAHSGQGIFFTSKISDLFILDSFNYRLRVDNKINDIFIEEIKPAKRGTKVTFYVDINSNKHLRGLFEKYETDKDELNFDTTDIKIKLYTMGTIYVSRSQARRVLVGLEKFKLIILDFDKVPTVGQAFADEIFRVFKNKYPNIQIKPINMNKAVKFMIDRVEKV